MIYSMTAFARAEYQAQSTHLICEMRSINHRYLDIGLHLPEALRSLDMPIRECIRGALKRGKVECMIRYKRLSEEGGTAFIINTAFAQALCQATAEISGYLQAAAPVSPAEILHFPGVIEIKEVDLNQLQTIILSLLQKTIQELMTARAREGEELKQLFLQRLNAIQTEVEKVKNALPRIITEQRERLSKRFNEAKLELDVNRLEQEMVMYLQKMDVAEELERIETHQTEIHRVLKDETIVGRRLDFLLQELNREANTLGSKATDAFVTHAAVEMKVLIEQMREQVQNIE